MKRPTQAVVLAGGRGTRLAPITDHTPKAMVEFEGEPFLGHIVRMLAENGFDRVLLLLGYLPEAFTEHFGDGSAYGVQISYRSTEPDDLTAHRVLDAAELIDETFLLLYCDNYWPMRWDAMWDHLQRQGVRNQVTVYANDDGYTRHSVIVREGMCEVFDRTRTTPGLHGVEISYAILTKTDVLPLLPRDHQELFEQAVYPTLAERGELAAFWTGHRYYSVGGHERLPLTEAFLRREPAIILDRDGTLNERPPRAQYVTAPEEFRWLPGALEALEALTSAGYRIIVVSNQAGIGRGAMTESDLDAVTAKMLAEAEEVGARIEAFYHCPHDWDEGCHCRKPAPGMLEQAQRDHHLDLTRTFFIGDDERDAEAALAAGANWALVGPDGSLLDITSRLLVGELERNFMTVLPPAAT
ncbi:MAG: HAD-IIIA family hydrolase [Actinobacteria bacterium]|nr:HAD-IIIA family hydrolase [Actinomycetota bacterium]